MLSAHFWMGTGATVAAAAVMGLGLGSYVTSPQAPARAAQEAIDAPIGIDGAEDGGTAMAQTGPGAIHCTGCGPTLAERRWQEDMRSADMAGLDRDAMADLNTDPIQTDYQVDGPAGHDAPFPATHRQSPQTVQFASGEAAPPSVTVTRVGQDAAPPPTVTVPAEGVLP